MHKSLPSLFFLPVFPCFVIVPFSIHRLIFSFHSNRSSPKTLLAQHVFDWPAQYFIKKPFSALNIHWLERRIFLSHWKRSVRFSFCNFTPCPPPKTSNREILFIPNLGNFSEALTQIFTSEVCSTRRLWENSVYLKRKCAQSIRCVHFKIHKRSIESHTSVHLFSALFGLEE